MWMNNNKKMWSNKDVERKMRITENADTKI